MDFGDTESRAWSTETLAMRRHTAGSWSENKTANLGGGGVCKSERARRWVQESTSQLKAELHSRPEKARSRLVQEQLTAAECHVKETLAELAALQPETLLELHSQKTQSKPHRTAWWIGSSRIPPLETDSSKSTNRLACLPNPYSRPFCPLLCYGYLLAHFSNSLLFPRSRGSLLLSTPRAGNGKCHLTVPLPLPFQSAVSQGCLPPSPSMVPTAPLLCTFLSSTASLATHTHNLSYLEFSFLLVLLLLFLSLTQSNCYLSTHTNGTHSGSFLPRMLDA